jgi:hypothetical protein
VNFGNSKNSEGLVRHLIRSFSQFCHKTNTTILCLWHPARAGMERGHEGGFSTSWDNACRNAISIKPDMTPGRSPKAIPDQWLLKAEKRNDLAKGLPLTLRWDDGTLQPVADAEAFRAYAALHETIIEMAVGCIKSGQRVIVGARGRKRENAIIVGWIPDALERQFKRKFGNAEVRKHLEEEAAVNNPRLKYPDYVEPKPDDDDLEIDALSS